MSNPTSISTGELAIGTHTIFNGRGMVNGFTVPADGVLTVMDGATVIDRFTNITGAATAHINYRQALRFTESLVVEVAGAPCFVMWGAS